MRKATMNVVIIMLLLALLFVSACIVVQQCPAPKKQLNDTGAYDLTKEDVFSLMKTSGLTSSRISIKGVKLGDTFSELTNAWGMPYSLEEFEEGAVINARYTLGGTNLTTLIFHLEKDTINRIVVKSPFNPELKGETVIKRDKAGITSFFGKPDRFEDAVAAVTYYYGSKGLEIYFKRKQEIGFGLVAENTNQSIDNLPAE